MMPITAGKELGNCNKTEKLITLSVAIVGQVMR
mgnify:CR=1 FL=1